MLQPGHIPAAPCNKTPMLGCYEYPMLARTRLLFVDDDEEILDLLTRFFGQHGYTNPLKG
jgi:hypothetical protein